MRPLTVVIGLSLIPVGAAGQMVGIANDDFTVLASHADHAGLHRPGPAEAAVPLAAAETMGIPRDATALCAAARIALTVGLVTDPDQEADRVAWFGRAQAYAEEALSLRPRDPDALFMKAAALGLQVGSMPLRDRIRTADRMLALTDSILAIDPHHAGGHHIRGELAATAMRQGAMVRFLVGKVFGSDALDQASWETAESELRQAVDAEPRNPLFRMRLAIMLRDAGRPDDARRQLRAILAMPGNDALTAYFRDRARDALVALP